MKTQFSREDAIKMVSAPQAASLGGPLFGNK